ERIADRIHDGLGERACIVQVYEQRAIGPRQRVCRSGALSIVQVFHVYPHEKRPTRWGRLFAASEARGRGENCAKLLTRHGQEAHRGRTRERVRVPCNLSGDPALSLSSQTNLSSQTKLCLNHNRRITCFTKKLSSPSRPRSRWVACLWRRMR